VRFVEDLSQGKDSNIYKSKVSKSRRRIVAAGGAFPPAAKVSERKVLYLSLDFEGDRTAAVPPSDFDRMPV